MTQATEYGIIKGFRFLDVVGTQHDMAEHRVAP